MGPDATSKLFSSLNLDLLLIALNSNVNLPRTMESKGTIGRTTKKEQRKKLVLIYNIKLQGPRKLLKTGWA